MVKITNKFGDVKTGKQHTVVYQGHYGNQTRRMLKENKDEHTRGQLEQRERFKTGIDFAKNLTKAQRDFIKSYMAEAGIRSPDGLPTTWYSFAKKIAMTVPKVNIDKESSGEVFSGDYANWPYRRPITLNNSGSGQSNYQKLITLTTENFDYSHCKSDGSDIRFTKSDKETPLKYYIQEWNYNGTSKLWVKVDSIPNGLNICTYIYYGNSEASDESDLQNTYEQGVLNNQSFESLISGADWEYIDSGAGGTLAEQQTDWITEGTYSIEMQEGWNAAFTATYQSYLKQGFTGGYAILVDLKTTTLTADHSEVFVYVDSEVKWSSTASDTEYLNESIVLATSGSHELKFSTKVWGAVLKYAHLKIDNIRVRKYVTPEPTVSSIGEEVEGGYKDILTGFSIHHPAIKSYELVGTGIKEENLSDLEDHISTVITRSDLNLSVTKIVVKTLANQEYEFIVNQQ